MTNPDDLWNLNQLPDDACIKACIEWEKEYVDNRG